MDETVEIAIFDLDGTLIFQDSLYEQIKAVLRFSKSKFFSCLFTLVSKGRVHFKERVFQINEDYDKNIFSFRNIRINPLVYNEYNKYKESGVRIIVATAAYYKTAEKVLNKIKIYPDLLIGTNKDNLKGHAKLSSLQPHIKSSTWAYYGDSKSDVPLFKAADLPYKVTPNSINRLNKL